MRIAHISDVYLPRLGGVEMHIQDLTAQQQHRGWSPVILTTTAPAADDPASAVPVIRLGAGPYRRVSDRDLAETLRACGAQRVHVHISAFSPLSWTAARVAASLGLPTVVTVHSMWHDILPLVRAYARWTRAAHWPVVWAAVSASAADTVRTALDGTFVAVLPNGIDPQQWRPVALPSSHRPPTVVSVMRMVRRKRPRPLLDILLNLQSSHPGRFRAVLVGDGPLLPGLRRRAASAGPTIRLTGVLPRTEIRRILHSADLYVAPALRESFGIAALEARSAGLPVLARAGSGIADFVRPGVEGWLADSDQDLSATLAGLLDNPTRLTAVAQHNRSTTPPMHWSAVLDLSDSLYEMAVRRQDAPLLVDGARVAA